MNLFTKACGATGPLQLHFERPEEPEIDRQEFDVPFVTIGRDPRADLCLSHRGISRRHAYLQIVAGRLFCLDLGSRIGTFVGSEFHQAGWIERQQVIRIGPYRLRLGEGEDESRAAPEGGPNGVATLSPEAPRLPRLFLETWDRSNEPSLWQVEREMALIGSSADCEVRLLDPSVSNFHCSLLSTPTGIWVVDLLGQDGLMVNGTSVRYARVYDGDELHLGNSLIRLRYKMPRKSTSSLAHHAGNGHFVLRSPPVGASAAPALEGWPGLGGEAGALAPPAGARPTLLSTRPAGPEVPSVGALAPEWIPSDAEPFAQGLELFNSLVFPMVDKFGLMQQQVLDQFQQSMMMMFQNFASLHHDQMDNLRQEFDQLRDLTQELVALRGELAAHSGSARDSSTESPSHSTRPDAAAKLPTGPNPPASALVKESVGGSSGRPPRAQGRPIESAGEAAGPPGAASGIPASHGRKAPAAAMNRPPAPGNRLGPGAGHAGEAGPEIHARLCHRIMAIQEEQKSTWQRIFGLMPGRSPKGSAL